MQKPGHLIICAESGVQVGTGHVMRCLALAQAWKRTGGAATFLLREGLDGIEQRIRAEGFALQTLPQNSATSPGDFLHAVVASGAPLAVLDGYRFGAREQAALTDAGIRVLTLDDYSHATNYPVHWVLNQNAYAFPEMYPRINAETRLLLGLSYALLRDEFLPWVGWRRTIPERGQKILITIGGSDPENVSERILDSLALLKRKNKDENKDLEVVLVIGGGNPHGDALRAASNRCMVPVRIERSVQDMPALMAWADVAISAAGGTSYELCYMGLPSILLIAAENQRRIAECLSELAVAVNAGTTREFDAESLGRQLEDLLESPQRRAAMSHAGRGLVDGLGSERVRAALVERELHLRPACASDSRLLYEWAVDPVARAASFHPAAISWEGHTHWFAQRMQDRQSILYIGENAAGVPVGLIRFQTTDDRATLSINVAREFRGNGWGRELIAFATRSLARTRSVQKIDALVKPGNQASLRLFEASGFLRVGQERVADQDALLFTWECGNKIHVH